MIQYKCHDGSSTQAMTASMALLHWFSRTTPKLPMPENPECFKVYIAGIPVPGPYHRLFLINVVGAIERIFGTSPDIIHEKFLCDSWYDSLPKNIRDHDLVLEALLQKDESITLYENTCWELLDWLSNKGEIFELKDETRN